MTLTLPSEKREQLRESVASVLQRGRSTIREIASLLGSFQAADPAIKIARLHYRALQRQKIIALKSSQGDFSALLELTQESVKELAWWHEYLQIDRPVAWNQEHVYVDQKRPARPLS